MGTEDSPRRKLTPQEQFTSPTTLFAFLEKQAHEGFWAHPDKTGSGGPYCHRADWQRYVDKTIELFDKEIYPKEERESVKQKIEKVTQAKARRGEFVE